MKVVAIIAPLILIAIAVFGLMSDKSDAGGLYTTTMVGPYYDHSDFIESLNVVLESIPVSCLVEVEFEWIGGSAENALVITQC